MFYEWLNFLRMTVRKDMLKMLKIQEDRCCGLWILHNNTHTHVIYIYIIYIYITTVTVICESFQHVHIFPWNYWNSRTQAWPRPGADHRFVEGGKRTSVHQIPPDSTSLPVSTCGIDGLHDIVWHLQWIYRSMSCTMSWAFTSALLAVVTSRIFNVQWILMNPWWDNKMLQQRAGTWRKPGNINPSSPGNSITFFSHCRIKNSWKPCLTMFMSSGQSTKKHQKDCSHQPFQVPKLTWWLAAVSAQVVIGTPAYIILWRDVLLPVVKMALFLSGTASLCIACFQSVSKSVFFRGSWMKHKNPKWRKIIASDNRMVEQKNTILKTMLTCNA